METSKLETSFKKLDESVSGFLEIVGTISPELDQRSLNVVKAWAKFTEEMRWNYLLNDIILIDGEFDERIIVHKDFDMDKEPPTQLYSCKLSTIPSKMKKLYVKDLYKSMKFDEDSTEEERQKSFNEMKLGLENDDNVVEYDVLKMWKIRISEETAINGIFRLSKYLFSMKCSMGKDWYKNRYVRMLKYYIEKTFGSVVPPFTETSKGHIINSGNDTLCAKKVEIISESIWSEYDGVYYPINDVMFEVIQFTLINPYDNYKIVKEIRGQCSFVAFTLSKSGLVPNWINSGKGIFMAGSKRVENIGNDEAYYTAVRSEYEKGIKMAKDYKLNKFGDEWNRLLRAEVNDINLKSYSIMRGIEQIIGYVHGSKLLSALEQFSGPRLYIPTPVNHKYIEMGEGYKWMQGCNEEGCYFCGLTNIWKDQVGKACADRKIPTTAQWIANTHKNMTSAASGLSDKVETKVYVRGRKVSGTPFSGSKEIDVKVRSKTGAYFLSDYNFFTMDSIIKAMEVNRTGYRSDIGRDERVICALDLRGYIPDCVMGNAVIEVQSQKPYFSLKKTSEKYFGNFSRFIPYTVSDNALIACVDVKQMDYNSSNDNVRKWQIMGTDMALHDKGPRGNFGEFNEVKFTREDGTIDYITGLQRMNRYFTSKFIGPKFTIKDFNKMWYVFLNQVLSGEKQTITIHNNTNYNLSHQIDFELGKLFFTWIESKAIANIYDSSGPREFTGDDSIQVIARLDSEDFSSEQTSQILHRIIDIYKKYGFPVKLIKFLLMKRKFEYLKKMFLYGIMITLSLRIRLIGDERPKFDLAFVDVARSLQSQLLERCSRGGDIDKNLLLRNMMILMRMDIRITMSSELRRDNERVILVRDEDIKIFEEKEELKNNKGKVKKEKSAVKDKYSYKYIIPFCIMFLPRLMNGFGWSPRTMAVDSKDGVLFLLLSKNELNYLVALYEIVHNIKWDITENFQPQDIFPQVRKRIEEIRGSLNPERFRLSLAASKHLEQYSVKVPRRFFFDRAPDEIARSRLKDLSEVKEVVNSHKLHIVSGMLKEVVVRDAKKEDIMKMLPRSIAWTAYIDFEFGDHVEHAVEPSMATPVAGPHGKVRELIRILGPGSESSEVHDLLKEMRKIYDVDYPDVVRPEEILEFIYSTPYYTDYEFIRAILILTGVRQSTAGMIAERIRRNSLNLPEIRSMQAWANSDSILSMVDVSYSSMIRVVTVNETKPLGAVISNLLLQLGFLLAITAYSIDRNKDSKFRKVTIYAGDEFYEYMSQSVILKRNLDVANTSF